MAIITNIEDLHSLITQDMPLFCVYEFLKSCLNNSFSEMDYKNNKKIDLEHGIFAILQHYMLKPFEQAFFETHKKYVDFQFTVHGNECFAIGDFRDFKIRNEYNHEKDLTTYHTCNQSHNIFSSRGCLCVFFPYDVHAGGLDAQKFQIHEVYKVVVKVPIEISKIQFLG